MVALQPLVNASNVWQGCFLPDDAKKGDADRRLFESLIRLRHLAYWIGMATRQAGRGPRDSRRQAWYRGPSPENESCAARLETGPLPLFRSNHRRWPERCAIPWSKDVSAEQRSPTPRSIEYGCRIVRSFAVRNRQSHCFQGQFHQSFSGFDLRRQVLPVPRWFGSRYISCTSQLKMGAPRKEFCRFSSGMCRITHYGGNDKCSYSKFMSESVG